MKTNDENRELPAGVRRAVVRGRTDGGHATVERVEIGPQLIERAAPLPLAIDSSAAA